MRVVIAGGHGKIALITARLLSVRGDSVAGLIRNPDHADDLRVAGAEPVVVDLENTTNGVVSTHLRGADAVIFAAGAGPGSGAARKETVDRDAAILLADAAEAAGVPRYVMVSSMGADAAAPDDAGDDVFVAYLRAKGAADDVIRARTSLLATIVRPGLLTDDEPTGRVRIAEHTGRGSIPRADVATVLVAVLDTPDTAGRTFEVISGDAAVADAVAALT
ncbi:MULTISPECIES: NAD(P)H-binding protein [Mycolicibacterium]|uniref:NAD(P)H-binding protein n=1 Tax=Mycolicibacterium austroafricanum TaxID=39687 RepID=A0ABT8HH15_MYCAO|nr:MULTISPECIES: NAD(P)H-binding protein [Mycolicibacterium]MDN4520046.1 NAD(P)H-binding protein [Mycolicibacterium austroafricanum]PQP42451.1 NAD-dependent dehydratase [Mycolicibacterium austroafricanum]QRZ06076.1 NAD(P)H-binding protein [Mycolicibacterium austroafricanum]QZT67561.1 NAD(P)H-binding protein [Mycolicibacterium austroafricanum]